MNQPDSWNYEHFDSEAQRLYEAGDFDQALGLLKEALARYPDSIELLVSLGYTRLAREEYAWARAAFEEVLRLDPEHEEALAGQGDVLLKLGERASAFLLFEALVALGYDQDVELMLCVGRSLLREGLLRRAERFFRLALAADPESADAALDLAFTFYREGDSEGALYWSREAVRRDPGFGEARALYGNVLYERGDFRAALAQLETIPAPDVSDPAVAWRIIELKRRLRDLPADAEELGPYLLALEKLTPDPTPEERLLAELEAGASGLSPWPGAGQLDLFGRPPAVAEAAAEGEVHRVRAPNGIVYEGDWDGIVRAMRNGSDRPGASLSDFMRDEAMRLRALTGLPVSWQTARAFLEDSARVGALEIER
ncbi:tetratricopeptide repeat protein [Candidatus Palauibacter sp.]|uniref:tetratricopeptide repeat protein n=1 Tax=Candidatus Palauibacter sp. TaxID=3101350 RepID=UPI003B02D8E2